MNIYFTLLIVVTSLFVGTSVRAEHLSGKWRCGETDATQLEMNYCAGAKYKHADEEMNLLYKEQMAALKTVDLKNQLRDAQRAWIIFRDNACTYEADYLSNGSMYLMEHYACLERHTQRRIEDLKEHNPQL